MASRTRQLLLWTGGSPSARRRARLTRKPASSAAPRSNRKSCSGGTAPKLALGYPVRVAPPLQPWTRPQAPPRIGVSTCLLGQQVRYDGGHRRDSYLVDEFGPHVEWVPFCPEVELGMGILRPPIRLEANADVVRLIAPDSGRDWTREMQKLGRSRARQLVRADLCGYVLKRASPSCGMERVKVWNGGRAAKRGVGVFAAQLLERLPLLPVEEEGRLNDRGLRESFIERVFAYQRLQLLFRPRWTAGDCVAFHSAHKLQLMAHSPSHYRELGRLVARVKGTPRSEFRESYREGFMAALNRNASVGRHTNALQHMAGYVSASLDPDSRSELSESIDSFRLGRSPRIVPLTLIRHHVRNQRVEYLAEQTYLNPDPREVLLENHA